MSNEFCLPITLNLLPGRWFAVALVTLHCLTGMVVVFFVGDTINGWWLIGAGLLLGASLARELHAQHPFRHATELAITSTTPADTWMLYYDPEQAVQVEFRSKMDFVWFVLVLVEQNGKKFRLVVRANDQPREQLHRFRLLLNSPTS